MEQVNIHEAKTHFSKLLEKLSSGETKEVVIAKAGKPIAKLIPFSEAPKQRVLGALVGQVEYWESPDCWEIEKEIIDTMSHGPLFPTKQDESDFIKSQTTLSKVSETQTDYEV